MSKCNRYGKDVLLPFKCSFCERFFCFEHKLPENHDCPNQPARAPLGPLKTKTLPESAAYSMKSQNEVSTEKPKRRSISKAIVAILLVAVCFIALIYYFPYLMTLFSRATEYLYPIQQPTTTPSLVPTTLPTPIPTSTPTASPTPPPLYKELVAYALSLINEDRTKFGLSNVSLSKVNSAQVHADNMLKYQFFSHWDTDGYKPYMRYTLAGGKGTVAENIAWQYSSGFLDVKGAIKDLEWRMMYDDEESDWGHRYNILDPFHNKVSIGVAHDDRNLYLVQDFENDYIHWSTINVSENGDVLLSGSFQTNNFSIQLISVYYDQLLELTPEQLNGPPYDGAYTQGTFVGAVLPQGYHVPEGITITAQTFSQRDGVFDISFDLSAAFDAKDIGIYTLYIQSILGKEMILLTSYSIWYDG